MASFVDYILPRHPHFLVNLVSYNDPNKVIIGEVTLYFMYLTIPIRDKLLYMTSKFDKIRPYDDADLSAVLNTLVNSKEFINTIVKFRFPKLLKWSALTRPVLTFFMKIFVAKKIANIHSLREFQQLVEPYLQRVIKKTTSALTTSGLDDLDMSKPCLFVSNHRDIALDSAFLNWVLHLNQQDTVRIAVGDNLLGTQWIADFFRLNKCFVVQRTAADRREKLAAAKLLSEYIQHSLQIDQQHLWIAQREGRAKDGIDITNPAMISMLAINRPKNIPFCDYVSGLRIVPVSISYEFDPCDANKAKELCQAQREGRYDKPDNEDMRSIVAGISGQKGKVHVHFGSLVGNAFSNTKELAGFIDEQILDGYCIFSTSQVALDLLNDLPLNGETYTNTGVDKYNTEQRAAYKYFQDKLAPLNTNEQIKLLAMYANPLLRKRQRKEAKAQDTQHISQRTKAAHCPNTQ